MKLNTLQKTLMLASALITGDAMAQITIEKTDFPIGDPVGFRSSFFWVENDSLYKTPTVGVNQVWDYSGQVGNQRADFNYAVTSDAYFSNSFHHEQGMVKLSLFEIKTDFHHRFDANGYTEFGKEQFDTVISLSSLTGGANDQIHFVDDKELYAGEARNMVFPLTYGKKWQDTPSRSTPFEISIAGFNLNKVPGTHKRIANHDNEVVGHGKLLMTNNNGNIDSMDVLLVKIHYTSIDSFYLGGAPAPGALLQGLGLTQGIITDFYMFQFYRKGYGDLLIELNSNSDAPGSQPFSMKYNKNGIQGPLSVQKTENKYEQVKLYPNPIHAGATLQIDLTGVQEMPAQFKILSLQGKEIQTYSGSSNQLILPNGLSRGVYLIQALHQSGAVLLERKLVVSQ